MSDLSIVQEFFDVPGIGKKMGCPISVDDLVLSASALRDAGLQCGGAEIIGILQRLLLAVGLSNFLALTDVPEKCEDHWAEWCPSPKPLHSADCPAGGTPLWSNGQETVFYRISQDKHGNDAIGFSIHNG